MAGTLIQLDVRTRGDWRRWLAKHHASSPGVWLLRHRQHTGITSMPYEDLVREALCFGWVDSLIRRLDENLYAIKVTPRQPTSKWSDLNRKRWRELRAAGLLAAPGLAAAPTANRDAPKPRIPKLPAHIGTAFKTDPEPGHSFGHSRPGTGVILWSGFMRPGDPRHGSGAFARLLNGSRPAGNSV